MTLWYRQIRKPITDQSGRPQPTPELTPMPGLRVLWGSPAGGRGGAAGPVVGLQCADRSPNPRHGVDNLLVKSSSAPAVTNLVDTTQFRHQTRPPPPKTGAVSAWHLHCAWESRPIWQVEETVRRTIALTIAGLFLYRSARRRSPTKTAEAPGQHSSHRVWRSWWGLGRCRQRVVGHARHRNRSAGTTPRGIAISRLVCRRGTLARDNCRPGWRKRSSHSLRHSSANAHRCRPAIAAASSTPML